MHSRIDVIGMGDLGNALDDRWGFDRQYRAAGANVFIKTSLVFVAVGVEYEIKAQRRGAAIPLGVC